MATPKPITIKWEVENRPDIPNMEKFTHWRVSLSGHGPLLEIMVPFSAPDQFSMISVQDGQVVLSPLQPLAGLRRAEFQPPKFGVYVGRVQLSSWDQRVLDNDNILVSTPVAREEPTVPVPTAITAT